MADKDLVIPVFKTHIVKNDARTKAEGRPIYDDMEVVEVRFAGDRNKVSVFPAKSICGQAQDDEGNSMPITYAERWPDQYKRFKAKEQQVASGTPLDELPFLTQAKRAELRGLNIFTAEALASIDGQPLKNLGQGGRDWKNQAQAYLDNAKGSADVTGMAKKIADLELLVSELRADKPASEVPAESLSQFESWEDNQIKDWIEQQINERPRGNPSHATLVKRADEIALGLADEQAA